MNFNKCVRCGCFYTTSDAICPKCAPKDMYEMNKLKDYLSENTANSINDVCLETGITVKNINRYLEHEDFSKLATDLGKTSGNIGLSL